MQCCSTTSGIDYLMGHTLLCCLGGDKQLVLIVLQVELSFQCNFYGGENLVQSFILLNSVCMHL